ncbi:hypothetical protein AK812_SmicGene45899, partial [Symbiodinium microadriaticum]
TISSAATSPSRPTGTTTRATAWSALTSTRSSGATSRWCAGTATSLATSPHALATPAHTARASRSSWAGRVRSRRTPTA